MLTTLVGLSLLLALVGGTATLAACLLAPAPRLPGPPASRAGGYA